jgi:hypothetical protein
MTFPSDDARDAWRSKYTVLVRDENIRKRYEDASRATQPPTPCAYSLRPREWKELQVEHVIEGQMDGFCIVSCPRAHAFFSRRLRAVDTSLPGFVRSSVLQPYYHVHNADLNVVFADRWSNMKKKAAVEASLKALAGLKPLERGLHGELVRVFRTGSEPVEADEAEACASRVVAALRDVTPRYVNALCAVDAAAPAFANMQAADRAAAQQVYADIGEGMGILCDEQLGLRQ